MAGISKEERLHRVHAEAIKEFNKVQGAYRDERLQCLQDRRFYSIAGAQWEGPLSQQYENKPRYEFNDVHLAVIRIINEYRNNRISLEFEPKDGASGDELCDACDGLFRADEQASDADEAIDNAFEEAVGGGIGAWRLVAVPEDPEDPDNDQLRVAVEAINDADSCVYFDIGAKRQDKSDATRCWVLTPYDLDAYKDEFGDDPATWPRIVHQNEFDWNTPRLVWVAEYYVVEQVSETVHYFRGLDPDADDVKVRESELEDDPDKLDEMIASGFREVRQSKVKRRRVHKYIMSGGKVLEDCGYIPGSYIPIIVTYGKRWVVDGIERCAGHVRLAKDAQRLKNLLVSWLAGVATRFDMEKPIFAPEQMVGWASMWANDNIELNPYLITNLLKDQQGNPIPGSNVPMGYTKAPSIPPVMAALMEFSDQGLQSLLGAQEAGEQLQPNQSGRAVELIQQRLDMQVFIYMSNLAKARKHSGKVWLSMMREIATEDSRPMKVIDKQGKASQMVLNEPAIDDETFEQTKRNDMSRAMFDVSVDVGPSSSSRRAATVRALTGMMSLTQDPTTQQILSSLAFMNLEGEGISDAREYFRKQLVQQGVIKPTKEEAAAMQQAQANQQPDPQSQYLLAAAQEANANAGKAHAVTVDTLAAAGLKTAQTRKTMAEIPGVHQQHAIDAMHAHRDMLTPIPNPNGPAG